MKKKTGNKETAASVYTTLKRNELKCPFTVSAYVTSHVGNSFQTDINLLDTFSRLLNKTAASVKE